MHHAHLGSRLAALVCTFTLLAAARSAAAATVAKIDDFGSNPTGIGMYLYTPSKVVESPPILVGVHACHGKGLDVCASGAPFAQQADKYGFLLICPSAVSSDGCWDVHSKAVLTHNGGGDAAGIISMVNYVVQNKKGDKNRVYVAGHSSGAMMTNVLLGSYPDVFKAGAAFAGVPFACFAQGSVDSLGWNSSCATGKVTMTGAQWGALVRAAYPDYTGPRPRMQLWHGTTDDVLNFHNFGEEIKEWTNVMGVSETPASTENNAVQSGWIRTRYKDSAGVVRIEAVQETGQPHNLVVAGAEAARFFGLDGSNPDPGSAGGGNAGAGAGGSAGNGAGGRDGSSGGGSGGNGNGGASAGGASGGAAGVVGVGGSSVGGAPSVGGSGAGGAAQSSAGALGLAGTANTAGALNNAGAPSAGSANAAGSGAIGSDSDESGCSVAPRSGSSRSALWLCGLLGMALISRLTRRRSARA